MAKSGKIDRTAEIENIRAWCEAVLEEVGKRLPGYATSMLRDLVKEAAAKQNMRGLRSAITEFGQMARDFPEEEQKALDARLRAKFGRGLHDKTDKALARILNRGAVKSDDEFRLLRDQLDDAAKAANLDEAQKARIKDMLLAYES